VTETAVLEYFHEVIAPEVKEWQGQRAPEQKTLGTAFLNFVKAAPLPEVMVQKLHFKQCMRTILLYGRYCRLPILMCATQHILVGQVTSFEVLPSTLRSSCMHLMHSTFHMKMRRRFVTTFVVTLDVTRGRNSTSMSLGPRRQQSKDMMKEVFDA